MSSIRPEFPITIRFEDGSFESYENREDIELNLEDFNSDHEPECLVRDNQGRTLRLIVSLLDMKELEFDPPVGSNTDG